MITSDFLPPELYTLPVLTLEPPLLPFITHTHTADVDMDMDMDSHTGMVNDQ